MCLQCIFLKVHFGRLCMYEGEWYWPLVNIAVALIAMVGCMSIDILAQWMLKPFRKAALKMLGDIINISQKIFICY